MQISAFKKKQELSSKIEEVRQFKSSINSKITKKTSIKEVTETELSTVKEELMSLRPTSLPMKSNSMPPRLNLKRKLFRRRSITSRKRMRQYTLLLKSSIRPLRPLPLSSKILPPVKLLQRRKSQSRPLRKKLSRSIKRHVLL